MAVIKNTPVAIRARDLRGEELSLRVVERVGLIRIEFDGSAIVMAPVAAATLAMHLLHALGGLVPPTISGGM